jgi:hypothetical protein
MYLAARAITTIVRITNAPICTQTLLAMPLLFTSWVPMVDHLPSKQRAVETATAQGLRYIGSAKTRPFQRRVRFAI